MKRTDVPIPSLIPGFATTRTFGTIDTPEGEYTYTHQTRKWVGLKRWHSGDVDPRRHHPAGRWNR